MRAALERPWAAATRAVYSSAERKATDAAAILAEHLGVGVTVVEALGENDRTATGYLPPAEFQATADAFFARPDESVRGWETALAAQERIVAAVGDIALPDDGDVAILSHGGVGALLYCHLTGRPIDRSAEQPGSGGGCYFAFDARTRALVHGWRTIEG